MDAVQREYDRFGPWVTEISDVDPAPRLFERYVTRSEPPLLSVKIPRHIERRNARPGMDLYDYVVSVYQDELVVLERAGSEVSSTTCRLRDVQLVRVTHCLLRGNVHLEVPSRPLDLPYNTVSDTLMHRLVELIRQRYAREPGPTLTAPTFEVPTGMLSFYFGQLLEAERRHHPDMRLLAAQGTVPVVSAAMGPLRRLLFRVADKRLLEAMHLSDGSELRIMSRGATYAYRWEGAYGLETTYIPVANVRSVEWRPDPANLAVALVLHSGAGDSTFVFTQDNVSIEPYAACLSSLLAESSRGRAPAERRDAA